MVSNETLKSITQTLKEMPSREAVTGYFAWARFNKKDLTDLCDFNNIFYRKSDKKDRLINIIAEALVGARLKHKALLNTELR